MFPEAFFDVSTMFAWEIAAVLSKTSTSIVLPSKLSSKFSTLRLPFFKFVWSILIFSELLQLRGGLYIYVLCMTQQILQIKILYIIIVMLIYYQYTNLHLFKKFFWGIQTTKSSDRTRIDDTYFTIYLYCAQNIWEARMKFF